MPVSAPQTQLTRSVRPSSSARPPRVAAPRRHGRSANDLDLSSFGYALERTVPGADLAALDTIRVTARAKEPSGLGVDQPWPATIKVKVGDEPPAQ